jgi:hypothetical protein
VSHYADIAARTPVGWPCFWIVVGLAAFLLAACQGLDLQFVAIAASAPLYGLGYLLFGVATGMRYHFWTMTGAALAAVLVIGEMLRGNVRASRKVVGIAAIVVAVPTLMAIASRLTF